ncbi:MAG: hypothetical protein HY670_08715 [Chloroflexi bacterium]|nr:hypothetical protein [Chloroflexota bacterium]
MVDVIWAERKSPVLLPSSLSCLAQIPSINLTAGCAHGCIYCYARGYSSFPGENKVVIYKNTLDKLRSELLRKRNKPRAVYFSPSSDIFQPIPEMLELSHLVLAFLLSNDIGVAFLTKGRIPDKTLSLLISHADKVRAQIGIITHSDYIRSIFEPNAASIDGRLEQMAKMVAGSIATESRVIPILPGITDTPDSINALFQAIASAGVKRAAISTLFLRPAIMESLRRYTSNKDLVDNLLDYYRDVRRLPVHAEHSSVRPLPRAKREEIYSRFKRIAKNYAIDLSICGCLNLDIGGNCNITGEWPAQDIQLRMFDQKG